MKRVVWLAISLVMILTISLSSFAAISSEVVEVTTRSATVHWNSDRNDVDTYTMSIDGQAAVEINKGQPITMTGNRGSSHVIEIIGTTTIAGKIYYLESSEGDAGIYYEMAQTSSGLARTGVSIPYGEMQTDLVLYSAPGLGYYQEAVQQTVIIEKVIIDITLLDTVTISVSSNNENYGTVSPEIEEVVVGGSAVFTATPTTNGNFVKWIEVTDAGYALVDIGYTERITLMPIHDMYIQAVFEQVPTEVADTSTPEPSNPNDEGDENPNPDGDIEDFDDPEDVPEGTPTTPNTPTEPSQPNDIGPTPNIPTPPESGEDLEDVDDPEDVPEGLPLEPQDPEYPLEIADIEDDIEDDDIPGFIPGLPKTAGIFIGFFGLAAGGFILLGLIARKKSQ